MNTSIKRKLAGLMAAVTLMTVASSAALADWGDADKDKGAEPRYKVGQYVEVYNTPLHLTTQRVKIIGVRKAEDGHWSYELDQLLLNAKHGNVDPCDTAMPSFRNKIVSADYIESN